MSWPGDPWYERYFTADYWVYAAAEYTAERTAAEVDYLAAVLAEAPGRRVLDVGCGTGRHAIGLAARGFDVTGVDVSEWSLSRAADSAGAAGVPVRWRRFDALGGWPPIGRFDAAVCVQAFGWGTDGQQARMLRSLLGVLAPGGLLVLDHSNVSAILRMYAGRSVAEVDGHTFEFERHYDQLTGRSGGVLRVRRPDGTSVEAPDDVRLYQPPEVSALLRAAGFDVLRGDADFRIGSPVGIDTRYVQFVARAPALDRSALAGHRDPVDADDLDLRWAPDEAEFVTGALTSAWAAVTTSDPVPADPVPDHTAPRDAVPDHMAPRDAVPDHTAVLRERARRYDLADPYAADRCAAVLGAHFGARLRPAQVTAGAGATGLLRALAGLAAGDSVLMAPLGHPELGLAAREVGAAVHHRDLSSLEEAVGALTALRPAAIVLDRPGVDGRVWPADEVTALATAAAGLGAVVVVDETCASYLPPAESTVGSIAAPNLIVVRSMSKGYCCGGLRVGFAVSSVELADRVRAVCPPLAVAALSVDVALDLLRQGDVLAGLRRHVSARKPAFVDLLAAAGCEVDAGDPRLPWVTVAAGSVPAGVAGKAIAGSCRTRLSVPLSEDRWRAAQARWQAAETATGGRR